MGFEKSEYRGAGKTAKGETGMGSFIFLRRQTVRQGTDPHFDS